MKQFSGNREPLSPAAARNCFLVNQFATPGLGSLMAGRWIAGTGQLMVCVIGFVLVLVWFFKIMAQYYEMISSDVTVQPPERIGAIGGILVAVAWFWSLVTSISILSGVPKKETPGGTMPPKL